MQFTQAYHGRSGVRPAAGGLSLSLAPNLRRDRVAFVGDLRDPVRFREAVSALHAVVVSDRRYKPKDRSAYQAYQQQVRAREALIRSRTAQTARAELAATAGPPAGLEEQFRTARGKYWAARDRYARFLADNDPLLFRTLVPCDPVVTVAPDCLLFEAFSKDESAYACLTAGRELFAESLGTQLGTTNVDYSPALFDEFQRLRTYRRTEFALDPTGFETHTEGTPEYREEKIDLPPSWLQGFLQVQAAMSLPLRRVRVSRDALYNLVAVLTRRRTRTGPRAVRFEFAPGQPVTLVLEPWELRIVLHDTPHAGDRAETVRVWGRDRLTVLARLLPVAAGADVFLLGSGLPSFWNVDMGGLRFLLGLSGWTANDWTRGGGAVSDLLPPADPPAELLASIAGCFRASPTRTFAEVQTLTGATAPLVAAGLNRFALLGQLVHDLPAGVYRWRQILPVPLALEQARPDSPEAELGRRLAASDAVRLHTDDPHAGRRTLGGRVNGVECELTLDADGVAVGGRCTCSHWFRFKLRAGPCGHQQALRRVADGRTAAAGADGWFRSLARGVW